MFVGNILILRSISIYKYLQTPINFFLASLAVADLLITLLLPIYAVRTINLYILMTHRATLLVYIRFLPLAN